MLMSVLKQEATGEFQLSYYIHSSGHRFHIGFKTLTSTQVLNVNVNILNSATFVTYFAIQDEQNSHLNY